MTMMTLETGWMESITTILSPPPFFDLDSRLVISMRAFGAARTARALASRHCVSRPVAPGAALVDAFSRSSFRGFSTPHTTNPNTFVSSHSQALLAHEPLELAGFLRRKELVFKETDSHFVVRECPFCHPTRGRADNLFKLYVHRTKGVYKCHRCGAAGSWLDFKTKVSAFAAVGNVYIVHVD